MILAETGRVDTAKGLSAELDARAGTGYIQPFGRAVVAAALGDMDRALALAEEALEARDPTLILFSPQPSARFLRRDRRFVDLMARSGIPYWSPGETRR